MAQKMNDNGRLVILRYFNIDIYFLKENVTITSVEHDSQSVLTCRHTALPVSGNPSPGHQGYQEH